MIRSNKPASRSTAAMFARHIGCDVAAFALYVVLTVAFSHSGVWVVVAMVLDGMAQGVLDAYDYGDLPIRRNHMHRNAAINRRNLVRFTATRS